MEVRHNEILIDWTEQNMRKYVQETICNNLEGISVCGKLFLTKDDGN